MNEIIVPQGKPTMETGLKAIVELDYQLHVVGNAHAFALITCAEHHPVGCECHIGSAIGFRNLRRQYRNATGRQWMPKAIKVNWTEPESIKTALSEWWNTHYNRPVSMADVMPAGELVWS